MLKRIFKVTLLAVLMTQGGMAVAQEDRPLILEGTDTIFERILTRPGAVEFAVPEGGTRGVFPAFSPLYVFARENGWVHVGPSPSLAPTAWLKEDATVLWKQNIVGAFTNAAGRSRQLLFDGQEDLLWLMNHEALAEVQERLVAEAAAGIIDGERGVVSVEPSEYVNIRDELYLMPILDFTESLHPLTYDDILLMQVASLPVKEEAPQIQQDDGNAFDVGIVFVLDTTQSMENYISLTQRVLQNTIRQIEGTEIGDLVNFGVIGFRDNTEAVPELEYRTRTFAALERRKDGAEVVRTIGTDVKVTGANSPGFNEDSLAAIEDAIDTIDWKQTDGNGDPIDARYVILVTDAGPKDPRDPNARSKIGTLELQKDAEDQNIVLMTLHLKTPNGAGNHDYAASRYRELSRFGGREFYFPIENGSETEFEGVATRLVTALTDHVRVVRGEDTVLDKEEAGADLVELGRAMQLAWLGSQKGTQAPDIIRGWVSNKAIEAPDRLAIEPRLLVTKNELATMTKLLNDLVTFGEQAQSSEEALDFFAEVQRLIAVMAQNPDIVVKTDGETLSDALEFLDRLPYKSQILGMGTERWAQSAMLRRSIIDGMRQKHTQYKKWLFNSSIWTALHEGAPEGEHVFAMPFDVLP